MTHGPASAKRSRAGRLAASLCALLLPVPLWGSIVTSGLRGRVTSDGAPAAGVTVIATSPLLVHPRMAVTGPLGTYWMSSLPPGEYQVTFEREGLQSLTRPARVELAKVARADAVLEVSEEGESVSSTARTEDVGDTTAITTHFSDDEIDRLPLPRDPALLAGLMPGPLGLTGSGTRRRVELDDLGIVNPSLLGEETVEEVTLIRGRQAVWIDGTESGVVVARTRRPQGRPILSLRDTYSRTDDESGHLFEVVAGGTALGDRLSLAVNAWQGDAADRDAADLRGVVASLRAFIGRAQSLQLEFIDQDAGIEGSVEADVAGLTATALRYSAVFGLHSTVDLVASRASTSDLLCAVAACSTYAARASHLLATPAGDHLITAGGSLADDCQAAGSQALFVSDQWVRGSWRADAGVRYEQARCGRTESEFRPRLAVIYDVRGNGRHAIAASHGTYDAAHAPANESVRVTSIGYAAALGVSGAARVDISRRDGETLSTTELAGETRYRLFDRAEAGVLYLYSDGEETPADPVSSRRQAATVWAGLELPAGDHLLGVTLLQRYLTASDPFGGETSASPTGLAIRFTTLLRGREVTLAGDFSNLGRSALVLEESGRLVRVWVRARI